MGQAVEQEALLQGHQIVGYYDLSRKPFIQESELPEADVCIEFTYPEAAYDNCLYALQKGYPVVSGTTGWQEGVKRIIEQVDKNGWTFFHSSNFSVGVNVLYALNKKLAQLMNHTTGYHPEIEEIHHIYKKDAPSGTAIQLADALVNESKYVSTWAFARTDVAITTDIEDPNVLPVHAERVGEVPGIHRITYRSGVDRITIEHEAFNRQGLAIGVLLAADYATKHKGLLTMDQLLGLE